MKAFVAIVITSVLLTLASHGADRTQPLDQDTPLAEGIQKANEMFPDVQPLTEKEVIAAVQAIKLKYPDIQPDIYDTYMRVVKEKVLPKGMYFRRITSWNTDSGRFQVDWKDLCLEGRIATEDEKREALSKMPFKLNPNNDVRVGGFSYRIRARFVSVDATAKFEKGLAVNHLAGQ